MFKRLIHLLLVLLTVVGIVALIAAAVIQVILWTDLPKHWVFAKLSKRTGMEFSAQEFRTSWAGTTTLKNLTIRFPLEDKPFVLADDVTLEHTWLIGLLTWQRFRLDVITINNASAAIVQDQHGRWNLRMLTEIERKAKLLQKSLHLPAIDAQNITLYIRDSRGRELTLKPAQMQARVRGRQWMFEASALPMLKVQGRIATHSPYAQRLQIQVLDLRGISSELLPAALRDLQMDVDWNGFIEHRRLTGRLTIERAQAAGVSLLGQLQVEAGTQDLQVRTEWIRLRHKDYAALPVLVEAGLVQYQTQSEQITLRDFVISSNEVRLEAEGLLDMRSNELTCRGDWLWVGLDLKRKTEGRWHSRALVRRPGLKSVEFEIEGFYQAANNLFQTHAVVSGAGTDWRRSLWTVRFPILAWASGRNNLNWGPGQVLLRVDWPRVILQKADFENVKSMQMSGSYAADKQIWQLTLDARDIRVRTEKAEPGMDVTIRASGDSIRAVLSEAAIHWGDFQAHADAAVRLADSKIEQGALLMSGRLPEYKDRQLLTEFSFKPWQFRAAVDGILKPTAMRVNGELRIEMPGTEPAEISLLEIPYKAKIIGPKITLETASFTSERGSWIFNGFYQMDQQAGRLQADVSDIPMSILLEPFGKQDYEGRLSAKLTADLPQADPSRLDVDGIWLVEDFSTKFFAAQKAFGRIHMKNGKAELTDVHVQQGAGLLTGSGSINVDARQASLEVTAADWRCPAGPSPVSVTADAQVTLDIDLLANRVAADGRFDADVSVLNQPAGSLQVTANLNNKLLDVKSLNGRLLDGTITGQAQIPLQDWTRTKASLNFEDIRLDRLSTLQPRLEAFAGLFTGQLLISRTRDKNPLEPLQIVLDTEMKEAHLNGAPLGGIDLTAFAGPNRVLLTNSFAQLFSGTLRAQARWTMHDRSYMHARAAFDDIDLNQVIQAVDPNANPVTGSLSGTVAVLTTSRLETLSASMNVALSNSDLANNTIISSVYNTLAPGRKPSEPSGHGNAELHARGATLIVGSFYYFNEGIEIRGSGQIEDIRKGSDSPVSGIIFGTTHPLSGLDLPGIKELDELMGVLQVGSAAVKIEGTLGNIQTRVVPLPEVIDPIRGLIWKQLHEE